MTKPKLLKMPKNIDVFINSICILMIISMIIFYIYFVKAHRITTFDDAYMFIRYAANFLAGKGVAWNQDGLQTYGTTSLLYLGLIIGLRWAMPLMDNSYLLVYTSACLSFLAIIIIYITYDYLMESFFFKKFRIPIAMVFALTFSLSPFFLFHATSGMDTSLALLGNSLLILLTAKWNQNENYLWLLLVVIVGYLNFLARPDNLIYSLTFPLLYLVSTNSTKKLKKSITFSIGLILLLILDTWWKTKLFGNPLPLPFYAKSNGFYSGYTDIYDWNPIMYLFIFCKTILPFLLILAITTTRQSPRVLFAFIIPIALTFTYYFSVTQIMGDGARYYFPAIPFIVVASFLALDRFIQEGKNFINKWRLGLSAFILISLLVPSVQTNMSSLYAHLFIAKPISYESNAKYQSVSQSHLPKLGWWRAIQTISALAQNLPPNTKFAMSEYGLIGAQALNIQIVDLLGLQDPYFAHHGFAAEEFFKRQPDIIWFPHPAYTKIVASIQDSSYFWQNYIYFPEAFDYGLAIRINSPHFITIFSAVKNAWESSYGNLDILKFEAHLESR
jgi:hypothetical protein